MGFDRSAIEEFGVEYREITQAAALEKFRAWREQGNLFRYMEGQSWLCLCCTCGCQWFRDKEGNRVADRCDPSPYVETTDLEMCTLCGECVAICPTGARAIEGEALLVDADVCYGCSACVYACPEEAVRVIAR
jgi:ferredoxin